MLYRIIQGMDPKTAADFTEFLKPFAQFGVIGLVAYLLGRRFLLQGDEDRKWIRETGERQMVLLEAITETNKTMIQTNSELVEFMKSQK